MGFKLCESSPFEMNTQIYFKLWFTNHDVKIGMVNVNQNDSHQKLSKHFLVYDVLFGLHTAIKNKTFVSIFL